MELSSNIFDVVGVGFGPANLALAIALYEWQLSPDQEPIKFSFVEKQEDFLWHGEMLLRGSRMQISFLKDLVTLRNPVSVFSFLSYLSEMNRLADFINFKTFYPSRLEFNDYLQWAAKKLSNYVSYKEEVVSIEPLSGNPEKLLRVVSKTEAGLRSRVARNVVIAVGGKGHIPDVFKCLEGNNRIFHTSSYLSSVRKIPEPGRIAIIGSGQSAIEILLDCAERFPSASIDVVFRGRSLKVSDDSFFVNEIYNPSYVDYIYSQPEAARADIIAEFRNTNYGAAEKILVERVYDLLYQQKISGHSKYKLISRSEISNAISHSSGTDLMISSLDSGQMVRHSYDIVVLATGYERDSYSNLLKSFEFDGDLKWNRYYRLQSEGDFNYGIYIQGGCEASHGLSDTLLSILPIRASEILKEIMQGSLIMKQ